ncbi:sensor histidine kinase [Motilibacter rhizosphaerae]|uniref:sensor histidine kinase n=1 Tax=Motilibacter rhizosphaerae TaxID=598652 RepID=UPI0013EEB543|nr:histidine kinase [Motilibacter rhizosphaerae]
MLARRPPRLLIDGAIAAVLCVTGQVEVFGRAEYDGAPVLPGPRPAAAVLVALLCLALLVRRRWPVASSATVLGLLGGASLVWGGAEAGTVFVAVLLTVYSGTAYGRRPGLVGALAGATAVVHLLRDPHVHGTGDVVFGLGLFAVAWVTGLAMRARHGSIGRLERHVDRLQREREEQIAAATAAERAAIARELHDIVAHAVSVVVIQAQVGRQALPARPEVTDQALLAVERTARDALVELRRLLTLLAGDATSTTSPTPSLAALDALVETLRASGLQVELERADDLPALPATVELTAYRVVQEALTNCLKHAPGARAVASVRQEAGGLVVEVADAGGGRAGSPGTGRGLIGMRERLALVDGTLEAGPTQTGFRVRAVIPTAVVDGPDTAAAVPQLAP